MTKTTQPSFHVLGIPLLLLASLLILVQSPWYQQHPAELSNAITLDLLLTIPLIYFLLIRKRADIPKITVLSVFVVCTLLAGFILPVNQQSLLQAVKTITVPAIEIAIVSFLIYKTREIIQKYPRTESQQPDFFDALTSACVSAFPNRIGHLLATEIAVVYFLFKPRRKQVIQDNEFTYYQKSGIIMIVGVFIGLIVFETFTMHLLVQRWSETFAWVLTGLSVYTSFQIIALLRSLPHRLIQVDRAKGMLHLRYGFFRQTSILLQDITSIEKNKRSLPEDKSIVQFSPLGQLDNHNLIIRLNGTNVLQGIYGSKKTYAAIALYVDEPDAFLEACYEMNQN